MPSGRGLSRPGVSLGDDPVLLQLVDFDNLLELAVLDEVHLGARMPPLVHHLVFVKYLVLPKQMVLGQKLFVLVLELDAALDLLHFIVYNGLLYQRH